MRPDGAVRVRRRQPVLRRHVENVPRPLVLGLEPRAVHAQTPTSSHQRHALLKSTRKVADGNALPCALHPFPYETGSLYVSILMFCYHATIQTLPIRSGLLLELLRIALRRSRWCDPSFYM